MKKNFIFFLSLLNVNLPTKSVSLDEIAIKYNTDKQPGVHNYTPVYDHYFHRLKNQRITFLEIGFGKGDSGHMWDEYFTNAEIHFIENDPKAYPKNKQPFLSNCFFHLIDQSNQEELSDFAQTVNKKFDIIIDDGSHKCADQILTFKTLFPLLKDGGYYVIEDLHTSYWKMYGGAGDIGAPEASASSAIQFLMYLVHDMNYMSSFTGCADVNHSSKRNNFFKIDLSNLDYFQRHIDSIHFHPSMCFICKKDRAAKVPA